MDELIKTVVKALFDELEKRFANRPFILIILNTLEALIPELIPLLVMRTQQAGFSFTNTTNAAIPATPTA